MAGERVKLEDVINQAKQLMEGGDAEQSILLCRHILKYYPRCLEATRVMGESYTEKRLLDEADQLFTFVLAADPHDVLGYVDRGFIAAEKNNLAESIVFYERALELDPNIEQLRMELLRLYREVYGQDRARLRPSKAGLAYQRLRDGFYHQAIDEFQNILRETPNRLDIQVGLIEAYWRNRDFLRAERLALDLLAEHPLLIKCNLILWHLYGVRRRMDKAANYLEVAQALDPLHMVAERLFEDAAASDNAMDYIAMTGEAQIPAPTQEKLESDYAGAELIPNWVKASTTTDQLLGLKGIDPDDEGKSSLKNLNDEGDWLQRLLSESEEEMSSLEKSQQGFAQLDELRHEDVSFDNFFEEVPPPALDLSQPGEEKSGDYDLSGFEAFDLELMEEAPNNKEVQSFNPANLLEEDKPDNAASGDELPPFDPDDLFGEPETANNTGVTTPFNLNDLLEAPPQAATFTLSEDASADKRTPAESIGGEFSDFFDEDIEPFTSDAPALSSVKPLAADEELPDFSLDDITVSPFGNEPALTAATSGSEMEDEQFLESLLSDVEPFSLELAEEEGQNPAVTVYEHKQVLEDYAFFQRDERGAIPDFAEEGQPLEAAEPETIIPDVAVNSLQPEEAINEDNSPYTDSTDANLSEFLAELEDNEFAHETNSSVVLEEAAQNASGESASSNKETEDMPIKKGNPEDENDLFDWEKEELPDYLRAFATEDNEAEQFAVGTNPPIADVSTAPARIRPRDDVTGGTPGDLPDWLNPAAGRQNTAPRQNVVDLSGSRPPGDLPNWLDKTLEGQGEPSRSFGMPSADLGMDDLQPFSPTDGDQFGGPSLQPPSQFTPPTPPPSKTPSTFSPTEMAFGELSDGFGDMGDLKPFGFDDITGETPPPGMVPPKAPPARPAPPPIPDTASFIMPEGMGDLQPFSPFGEEMPPQAAQPSAPPRQQQPQAPSPRNPFGIGGISGGRNTNTPPPQPANNSIPSFGDDFGDLEGLEPFSLTEERSPAPFAPSEAELDIDFPFDPNPTEAGFQDMGGMKLSDLASPFSMDNFGEEAPAKPNSNPFGRSVPPKRSNPSDFLPDDLDNPDLTPFSPDSLDIPGLNARTPASLRPDPNAYQTEQFYPSNRRPREQEQEIEFEPGQEKPLRRFGWVESRKRENARKPTEEGESPFARMAARRRQETERFGKEAEPEPFLKEEIQDENFEELLSFEEIEKLAASGATRIPATPATEPVPQDNGLNLDINLDTEAFGTSLEESLPHEATYNELKSSFEQGRAESSIEQEEFQLDDLTLEPFDMSEFSTSTPQKQEGFEAELPIQHTEEQPFAFDFNDLNPQNTESTEAETDSFKLDSESPEIFGDDISFFNPPALAQEESNFFNLPETAPETNIFGSEQSGLETDKGGLNFEIPTSIKPEEPFSFDLGAFEDKNDFEPFNFAQAESPLSDKVDFFGVSEPEASTQFEPFSFEEPEAAQPQEELPFDLGQLADKEEFTPFSFGEQEIAPAKEVSAFDPNQFEDKAETAEPDFSFDLGELGGKDEFEVVDFGHDGATAAKESPLADLGLFDTTEPDFGTEPATSPPPQTVTMSYEEAAHMFGFGEEKEAEATEHLPVFDELELHKADFGTAAEPVVEEVKPQPEVAHAEEVVANPPQPVAESVDVSGLVSKVKANPRDLNANLGLGDAYFKQQDYKQAVDYYAMSVKLADKNSLESIVEKLQDMVASPKAEPRFHRVLGDAYMKQGHYHWALSEYSKALNKK